MDSSKSTKRTSLFKKFSRLTSVINDIIDFPLHYAYLTLYKPLFIASTHIYFSCPVITKTCTLSFYLSEHKIYNM